MIARDLTKTLGSLLSMCTKSEIFLDGIIWALIGRPMGAQANNGDSQIISSIPFKKRGELRVTC